MYNQDKSVNIRTSWEQEAVVKCLEEIQVLPQDLRLWFATNCSALDTIPSLLPKTP